MDELGVFGFTSLHHPVAVSLTIQRLSRRFEVFTWEAEISVCSKDGHQLKILTCRGTWGFGDVCKNGGFVKDFDTSVVMFQC